LYSSSLAVYCSNVKLCQPIHFPDGDLPHTQSFDIKLLRMQKVKSSVPSYISFFNYKLVKAGFSSLSPT